MQRKQSGVLFLCSASFGVTSSDALSIHIQMSGGLSRTELHFTGTIDRLASRRSQHFLLDLLRTARRSTDREGNGPRVLYETLLILFRELGQHHIQTHTGGSEPSGSDRLSSRSSSLYVRSSAFTSTETNKHTDGHTHTPGSVFVMQDHRK